MQTMSPLDASFLHVEDAVTHMHIGSVGIFEGPAPGRRGAVGRGRHAAAAGPSIPAEGALRAAGARPPGLGRRSAFQPRLPRPAHGAAGPGRRRGAAQPGRPGDVAAARSGQAAVGDVGRRGARRRALGADLKDPSLHGRRRLGDGSAERDPEQGDASRSRRRLATGKAEPEPNSVELVAHSLALRAASPYEAVRTALSAVRGPRRVARKAVDTARGVVNMQDAAQPQPRQLAERPDRPASTLGLGACAAVGHQADPRAPRRHDQRRGAGGDHQRLPRASAVARRDRRGTRDPLAGAGLGARRRTSTGPTTTRSRRCSPSCRSRSRTPSSGWSRCTSRCSSSSTRARRWPPSG